MSSKDVICPESTIDSAGRRGFVRKAAMATAGAAIGGAILGGRILPNSSAHSNSPSVCFPEVTTTTLCVRNTTNIDICNLCNGSTCASFSPGQLLFGTSVGCSCTRIGSQRNTKVNKTCVGCFPAGNNLYGLDIYTNYKKRVSITNSGNVGIGSCSPNAPLGFGEGVGDKIFLFDYPGVKYGLSVFSCQLRVYHGPQSTNFTSFGNYNGTTFSELMRLTNQGRLGIGTTTPGTSLQVNGSVSAKIASPTDTYIMGSTDFAVLANADSVAFTVTLPAANTAPGMIVHVKKIDVSKNVVTVAAADKDKIEGKPTESLSKQYKSLTLISDGNLPGNWYILSNAT